MVSVPKHISAAQRCVTVLTRSFSVRGVDLTEIYSENVVAKLVQVAQRGLKQQVGEKR
jgi:hypothetical protein